jgi:hypothetical protein
MVAGDDVDRGSGIGDADERGKGQLDQGCRHSASIEEVTAVHDEVDVAAEGRLEGALKVGDKVVPPAPSLDARADG